MPNSSFPLLHETKDALATYNAIIKYNKDARAYYLRGDLYMDMGEEKKGKADFESAVQHGKKNYEIYKFYAIIVTNETNLKICSSFFNNFYPYKRLCK